MQEENRRLIDEALYEEPIKNTFRLSWELLILNRQFTLTAMSLLLLLNLLTAFLGVLAMLLSGIFTMAIQIYVAKLFYEAKDINMFITHVKESKVENAVAANVSIATGGYLGEITLMFLSLVVTFIGVQMLGFDLEGVKELEDLKPLIQFILLPMIFVLLLVSYIHPLVQAKITMARDFKEGFFALFSIFSLALWRDSFQSPYMRYMLLMLSLVLLGALFVALLISIPFLNLLGSFILIVVMYGYMILMSIASMMGKRMLERVE